jgi:hypothetical protein
MEPEGSLLRSQEPTTVPMDFVHRPEFLNLRNKTFREPDLFTSSCEGGETPTLLGPTETE